MRFYRTLVPVAISLALGMFACPLSASAQSAFNAHPVIFAPKIVSADNPRAGQAHIWGACGRSTADDKIVRTFNRIAVTPSNGGPKFAAGRSNLLCGNSSFGYRHIVKGHQTEWEQAAAPAGLNWRDIADFGIEWTLKDPDHITYNKKKGSYCFSRLIYLVNTRSNQTAGQKIVNVVVGAGNKRIVTAWPRNGQCTTGGSD